MTCRLEPFRALSLVAIGLLVSGLASGSKDAAAPPLYDEVTPDSQLVTLPGAGGFVSFRAERRQVTLWGQPLAVLLYSGPLADGQREHNEGRWSLITIPRNPSAEILFLRREVWPALGSPFLSIGGFRGLAADAVLPPDDARLDTLERNLLRAAWYPLVLELGLAPGSPWSGSGQAGLAFRRLQETVIADEERNGFLHEAQHALDEAWKVYPERFRPPVDDPVDAELRAALAALAHSETPHYELYQSLRQYRRRQQPYEEAVRRLFRALADEMLASPDENDGVVERRNLMMQLPKLAPAKLREVAAAAMSRLFGASDRRAGYVLDYSDHPAAAAGLRVGAVRGEIRADDLPAPADPPRLAATWGISGDRVEASGLHVYASGRDVQPARANRYGMAIGPEGYLAVHVRVTGVDGPWLLEVEGGRFEAGKTAGADLPLQLLAGDRWKVPLQPGADGGTFRAQVPAAAAAGEILRLVLAGTPGSVPPAFLTGLRLLQARPDPDPSG